MCIRDRMTIRYIMRLIRFLFYYDPVTMLVGHSISHEMPLDMRKPAGNCRAMWTIGFLALFFGLLAAGMPIFLVLGMCASVLYWVSGEPLIGVAQVMIDHLN